MAVAIRESHHLVFERRAVARTDSGDLSVEERRLARCAPAPARALRLWCAADDRRSAFSGRSVATNENGVGSASPCSTWNTPRRRSFSKSIDRRASRGGVPVFSRPHSKPKPFSDSARSLDGGSPARPAGRCSRPTWISPLRNVPVVIDQTAAGQALVRPPAPDRRPARHAPEPVPRGPESIRSSAARSSSSRTQAPYRRLSACARGDHTAGPRLRLSILNCRPVASMALPINPPSASISLTRWPLAVPPTAGLHGMSATVSVDSVQSPTEQPRRAAAHAASTPACPAPTTITSTLII